MAPNSEELAQFISITQASPEDAARFLEGSDFETAVSNFFAAGEVEGTEAQEDEPMLPSTQDEPSAPTPAAPSGPRTLSGAPAAAQEPLPAGWGQPARNMLGRVGQSSTPPNGRSAAGGSGPRIATLGSVGRAGEPDNLYTGGEKSGLAVQNPNGPDANPLPENDAGGIIGNILKQATEGTQRLADRAKEALSSASPSAFAGAGNTLGSDETPSTVIPGPSSRPGGRRNPNSAGILQSLGGEASDEDEDDDSEEEAKRSLTFWKDGFNVEDGPLIPYDAPGSKAMLDAVHRGVAPPSFFNVRHNQPMQLLISQRTDEMYRPPPARPVGMFEGQGNRLGAVTPEVAESSRTMPGAMPASILQGRSGSAKAQDKPIVPREFSVDESQPATRIQVRLGDGTRLAARVNLTHTVGDLRNFIDASRADHRAYALQTTFPNRDLTDDNETIEQAKLSNAVVVQRWL